MPRSLRVLAVCTHNRTRSVMVGGLLDQHARAERLNVVVRSAGFDNIGGAHPTEPAVRLLRTREIDVSDHRSHILSSSVVCGADLIITAEHDHVVNIAGRWSQAYRYTFTLPELIELGERVGPRRPRTFPDWLATIHAERPEPSGYLDTTVGEIADPTGRSPADWSACFTRIDDLTSRLAALLA